MFIEWYVIPLLFLIIGLFWSVFIYEDGGGYLGGLGNFINTLIILTISGFLFTIFAIFVR